MIIHENGLGDVKDVQSALGHNSEPKAWEHRKDFPLLSTNFPNDMSQKEGQTSQHPNISFLRKK